MFSDYENEVEKHTDFTENNKLIKTNFQSSKANFNGFVIQEQIDRSNRMVEN